MAQKIGAEKQDEYSPAELAEMIGTRGLEKGSYNLDVGDDGYSKIARVKKHWIQKSDLS